MKKRTVNNRPFIIFVLAAFAAILFTILPFVPGPSILNWLINKLYVLTIFGSIGLILPLSLTILISVFLKKLSIIKDVFLPIFIFVVIALLSFRFITPLFMELGRGYAIKRASPLIKAIENFKKENDNYPKSLYELQPKYLSKVPNCGLLGTRNYSYELIDNEFVLSFSQNINGWNWEVVTYRPSRNYKTEGGPQKVYYLDDWAYYIFD